MRIWNAQANEPADDRINSLPNAIFGKRVRRVFKDFLQNGRDSSSNTPFNPESMILRKTL
jgi:DNA primase